MEKKPVKIKINRKKSDETVQIPTFPEIDLLMTDWAQENANEHLTTELKKLIENIKIQKIQATDKKEKNKHAFRIRQFENACTTLENHPETICSGAEAQKLKGIGKGIAQRIDEILESGELSEIGKTTADKTTNTILDLMKVSGIGEVSAKKLVEKYQIKSLDDLKARADQIELTHHIKVCLEHFDDIRTKIDREIIDRIKIYLEKVCRRIFPESEMEICGSYRREKAQSSDIDVLISCSKNGLAKLARYLTKNKFLIEHLTDFDKKEVPTKYMGICWFEDQAHRIDIRMIAPESYGAAMLYFTGSKKFNQIFRKICLDRGMTLNEYGLYRKIGKDSTELIPTESERDIFKIVGIKYLTPKERELT
jgi:DNA polymerase/3'-5' exonuclease PolX